MSVLNGVDVSFIDAGTVQTWHLPWQAGTSRIGGIDINKPGSGHFVDVMALSA